MAARSASFHKRTPHKRSSTPSTHHRNLTYMQQLSRKKVTKPTHKPSFSYANSNKISDNFDQFIQNEMRRVPFLSLQKSTPKPKSQARKTPVHRRANSQLQGSYDSFYEQENKHHRNFSEFKLPSLVVDFSSKTQKGFNPSNPNKVNQDSWFAQKNFSNRKGYYLFSVCDGHGYYGEQVSGFIKHSFPETLLKDPNFPKNPRRALISSLTKVSSDLNYEDIDAKFSGSTLVSVFIKDFSLFCANIGDSRAFMGRQLSGKQLLKQNIPLSEQGKHWMAIALTRDHKPDERDESARILHCGGRIMSYQDEHGNKVGPARVWLKHQDLPGLAMSRSIGDMVVSSVGVISDPEILEFNITQDDKFVVLGSDGIFEFMSNEDVVKVVVPYWKANDSKGAAEALVRESTTKWKVNEEVIDDITCIVIFLGFV